MHNLLLSHSISSMAIVNTRGKFGTTQIEYFKWRYGKSPDGVVRVAGIRADQLPDRVNTRLG
jgi:hypothetical protein